jgi:hypothetical protein
LENSEVNILFSIEILEDLIKYLKSIKSEDGFKQLLVDAKKLAEDIDVETEFPPLPTIRLREKKYEIRLWTYVCTRVGIKTGPGTAAFNDQLCFPF